MRRIDDAPLPSDGDAPRSDHRQKTYVAEADRAVADKCPDCGRPKAKSAADAALGWCPKWWALYDGDAQEDCKRAAEKKALADSVKLICPKCESRDLTVMCDHCDWENNGLKVQRMAMLEDANRRANEAIGNQAEELGGIIENLSKYKRAAEFSQMALMEESNGRVSLHETSEAAEAERQRTYQVINENVTLGVNCERMRKALEWAAAAEPKTSIRDLVLDLRKGAKHTLENLLENSDSWTDDDQPLPEDEQIRAAHPMETDDHETYEEALRMVGAKRSKYALVDLVNWLLRRIKEQDEIIENSGRPF